MLCFAYDEEEYISKRGLYVNLHKELPCPLDINEDLLLKLINEMDFEKESSATKAFHQKYAPFAGNASSLVVKLINTES